MPMMRFIPIPSRLAAGHPVASIAGTQQPRSDAACPSASRRRH
jgi:hypothetical protein